MSYYFRVDLHRNLDLWPCSLGFFTPRRPISMDSLQVPSTDTSSSLSGYGGYSEPSTPETSTPTPSNRHSSVSTYWLSNHTSSHPTRTVWVHTGYQITPHATQHALHEYILVIKSRLTPPNTHSMNTHWLSNHASPHPKRTPWVHTGYWTMPHLAKHALREYTVFIESCLNPTQKTLYDYTLIIEPCLIPPNMHSMNTHWLSNHASPHPTCTPWIHTGYRTMPHPTQHALRQYRLVIEPHLIPPNAHSLSTCWLSNHTTLHRTSTLSTHQLVSNAHPTHSILIRLNLRQSSVKY